MKTRIVPTPNHGSGHHPLVSTSFIALVVTSYISFFLVVMNRGFQPGFLSTWLTSWLVAFVMALPSLLFVAPALRKMLQTKPNHHEQ